MYLGQLIYNKSR